MTIIQIIIDGLVHVRVLEQYSTVLLQWRLSTLFRYWFSFEVCMYTRHLGTMF